MDKLFSLQAPIIYSLEITPACSNRCPGCGNVFEHQKAVLSAKQWQQILGMLQPHARQLKLTGGEPTLHPEFARILEEVDALGIPFTIFTNARWTHPDAVIRQCRQSKHLGGLLVSLHGADAASHEAFTGTGGSFAETCRNIELAVQAGLQVHTSTVLHAKNTGQVEAIAGLSRALGARRAVFNRFLGPSDSPCQPSDHQLRQAVKMIEGLRTDCTPASLDGFTVRYGNCIPQCFTPSGSSGCWAGVAYCTVDPWGNLRPCNHSPSIIGNLFHASLEEVWQSEAMQRWCSLTPGGCFACTAYERCHGGCRALTELDQQGRDPLVAGPIFSQQESETLDLYQYARPVLNCDILPAVPGMALARGLSIFPVLEQARPILDDLNGKKTLLEIEADHGVDGLNFTGELVRRGYVTLKH